jgi:DNA-binding YbaB/EbfC family protein
MFGDLMGNMQEQQEQLREKLRSVTVQGQAGSGAVVVTAYATGEITDLVINDSKVDVTDTEGLQDLIIVAINEALKLAKETEQREAQGMLSGMLPPGMDQFKNLFGE